MLVETGLIPVQFANSFTGTDASGFPNPPSCAKYRTSKEMVMSLSAGAKKTEHNGPKRGRGAWCRKRDAKLASSKRRREYGKKLIKDGV